MVRNKACPEGSIVEGHIADKCLTFCSRYFDGVETRFNRPLRNLEPSINMNKKYLFSSGGHSLGKSEDVVLDEKLIKQVHQYILRHYDGIEQL